MVLNRADDPYTYWHHVDCFLKDLESLDASGVTAEELFGFTNLKKEDKEELKTKFIPPLKQAKKGYVCPEGYYNTSNLLCGRGLGQAQSSLDS